MSENNSAPIFALLAISLIWEYKIQRGEPLANNPTIPIQPGKHSESVTFN